VFDGLPQLQAVRLGRPDSVAVIELATEALVGAITHSKVHLAVLENVVHLAVHAARL
jgi:hypothetical protein